MSRRTLTVIPAALAVLGLAAAPASARPLPRLDDAAYALSTGRLLATDPASVTDEAWQVLSTSGPITATNTATAVARNCPPIDATYVCQAEAVAFQIILVSNVRDVTTLTLTDQGSSEFKNCTGCAAYSVAQQFVVTGPGAVTLTPEGDAALQVEHSNLDAILASPNPQSSLSGALPYIVQDVRQILATDVTGWSSSSWKNSDYVASPGGSAPSSQSLPF
jgi:hypothetical protein